MARGRSVINNYATSADCAATLRCLAELGARVERDGTRVSVEGTGGGPGGAPLFRAPTRPLDCGNSGSTMRMLAGVVATQPFASTLTGDASLSARPMRRIIEPLEQMGARISAEAGHAPLVVVGRSPLAPLRYEMPVASAQVKSCVLLAGLGAAGRTSVIEAGAQTRDHTERMLSWFGVPVEISTERRDGDELKFTISLEGAVALDARAIDVPGDISSAAFLIAAAALLPDSELTIEGVGLNPTRTQILETLRRLGADVSVAEEREECNEPVGQIRVSGRRLAPAAAIEGANVLRGAQSARLIDELPVLAVVGTQVRGGLEIRDAKELRVKESDRIRTTVENLRAMGAHVEEYEDGLRVDGPVRLKGSRLSAHGDHRIAMAFTIAALVAEGESEITGAEECVGVSFPEFFELLEALTER